jgi:protein phosphatase
MLEDEVIRQTIVDNDEELGKTASALINKSNEAGGKDNISVILARQLKPFTAGNGLFSRFIELFS